MATLGIRQIQKNLKPKREARSGPVPTGFAALPGPTGPTGPAGKGDCTTSALLWADCSVDWLWRWIRSARPRMRLLASVVRPANLRISWAMAPKPPAPPLRLASTAALKESRRMYPATSTIKSTMVLISLSSRIAPGCCRQFPGRGCAPLLPQQRWRQRWICLSQRAQN
jgi:hypothetical protein